jgi:predicted FMN-binding regulatory protein PaiB
VTNAEADGDHALGAIQLRDVDPHPLAALVTAAHGPANLYATHLPLVLERSVGPLGTLRGHLARANPHARIGPRPTSMV